MDSLKPNNKNTATTLKRKRVEKSSDDDTFLKRNLGLFNKVTELSVLCEAETAMIVSSQTGKLYACGYPSPDVVIQWFLSRRCPQEHACVDKKNHLISLEILRLQHEALEEKFKEEKEKLDNVITAQKVGLSSPLWWNNDTEEMSLEDLEQFKASMEQLKLGVGAAVEEKRINSMQPMPMPLPVVPPMASLDQFKFGLVAAEEEKRINSMQPMPMPLPIIPPLTSLEQLQFGLVAAEEEKRINSVQPMCMPLPIVPPMASLEQLQFGLVAAEKEKRMNSMQPMPMPLPVVPPMASLERLNFGLVAAEEEKRINSMQPMFMPLSDVPPMSILSNHVPIFSGYFNGHQVLDWNNGIGRSNSNVATVSNGFNHYYVKKQGDLVSLLLKIGFYLVKMRFM